VAGLVVMHFWNYKLIHIFCMTTRTGVTAMRKWKERKRHDSLALVIIYSSCKIRCKGQPGGRYSLFFISLKSNKKEKICCGGLAWVLQTDDAEYRFTCVRV
jgi:hypothetical protein